MRFLLRTRLPRGIVARALPVLLLLMNPATGQVAGGIAGEIRQRVDQMEATGTLEVRGVTFGSNGVLARYYASRSYEPAWSDTARVGKFLDLLAASPEHGLDPGDFLLDLLRPLSAAVNDEAGRAELDLLLTEALVRYGYQRRFGKVNPESVEPAWNFGRGFAEGTDPVALLADAVAAPDLGAFLDARVAGGPWYQQLQGALARYRAIAEAGGWPEVGPGPAIRAGDRDPRVPALRERLRVEGDLSGDAAVTVDAELYDEALAGAVRSFQERHSLDSDRVVGARTLEAMNVPAAARVDQIRMSLERVRWLTGAAPETYVVVNVAGFRVGFVRNRKLIWNSRVVVGRAARQTPVFRGLMTYIELNPTWTVPPTILREDILPKVKKDPGYLRREKISVIDRDGRTVDPSSVNWKAYSRGVPYTLRQEPGPANSLGRIKLMFPNSHAVYLHDTPAKSLFEQAERNFSSGCIRVEDPLALAELVLDDPAWTRETLQAAIETSETRRVSLKEPVPVLLVYLTAIADPRGVTRFFRDVYGRDGPLLKALNGPVKFDLPPARVATSAR